MTNWSVVRCTGGAETAAADRLTRLGYSGAWWPTEEKNVYSGAKMRGMRKKGKHKEARRTRIVPYIPGYLFVPCEINADRVRSDPEARVWMGAFIVNGRAVSIPEEDMCCMRDIPSILRERLADMEAALRAEREAKIPAKGECAIVVGGLLKGQKGPVLEIDPIQVRMDLALSGPVNLPVDMVERVA